MSLVARWSYKATATVWPFLGEDSENGGILYGDSYEIACAWECGGKAIRLSAAPAGGSEEFVPRWIVYTEDARPQYRDRISVAGAIFDEEIRDVTGWGMEMFNDTPDYRLAI